MAKYGVSKQNGSDLNPGTLSLPKATLQAGINLATAAGDLLYVGPGTYRELITNSNDGAAGNRIQIIADRDALVLTADSPGLVRVTGCSGRDEWPAKMSTQGVCYLYNSDYVDWHGFYFDGMGRTDITTSQYIYTIYNRETSRETRNHFYDCTIKGGANGAVRGGRVYNCLVTGSYRPLYITDSYDSIVLGGSYGTFASSFTDGVSAFNSIFIGNYTGTYYINAYNCMIVGGNLGFRRSKCHNCISFGSYYGAYECNSTYGYLLNHLSSGCYYLSSQSEDSTTGFYDDTWNDTYENTSTNWTEVPIWNISPNSKDYIKKAFEPFITNALSARGDVQSTSFMPTDILERPRQMLSGSNSADIGPYAISNTQEKWDTPYYKVTPPGIYFEQIGQRRFDVYASTGDITISCWARCWGSPASNGARIGLSGDYITAATDKTFDTSYAELSVTATLTGQRDQTLTFWIESTEASISAAFSDIQIS